MEQVQLKVKAKRRILKYAEGVNPETDAPFEIQEEEVELTGEDAKRMLEQAGVSIEEAKAIAQGGNQ